MSLRVPVRPFRVSLAGASALLVACGHNTSISDKVLTPGCPPEAPIHSIVYDYKSFWGHVWKEGEVGLEARGENTRGLHAQAIPGSRYSDRSYKSDPIMGIAKDSIPGNRLDSPYVVHEGLQMLAVAEYPSSGPAEYAPPSRLRLISLASGKASQAWKSRHPMDAIAWSPSGRFIAVLGHEDVSRVRTLADLIAAVTRPIPYHDVFLTVMTVDGQVVCDAPLARDWAYGSGFVTWRSAGSVQQVD